MKTVLITGAAKRVGRGLALKFADEGWHVCAHYNSSDDAAAALSQEIEKAGGSVSLHQADLSSSEATRAMAQACFSQFQVDCLINNASDFSHDFPGELDEDVWRDSIGINLLAPIILSEVYFKNSQNQDGRGCIINILDNKVFSLNPDFFSYSVSKSGLLAATKMMAMAFQPSLRVCAIAPGITLPSGKQSEQDFERVHKYNLLKRGVCIDDIAQAALFILSSDYATGGVITLDGGQGLQRLARDVAFLATDNKEEQG